MLLRDTILVFYLCLSARWVSATQVNVTVDDTDGDDVTGVLPVYQPSDKWAQGPCGGCGVQLVDPKQAFKGTWHDATSTKPEDVRNITVQFTGESLSE
jgi:hypothetical protein